RPARAVGWVRAQVGARDCAGNPPRADAGARRCGVGRVAPRAWGGGLRRARAGSAALAAAGGLARAGAQPRRGDGGAGVRAAGPATRRTGPAELAGTVATLFQDPEDQVVFTRVGAEVAFGLENVGTPPAEIPLRAAAALEAVGAAGLADRPVAELSGGELQRV